MQARQQADEPQASLATASGKPDAPQDQLRDLQRQLEIRTRRLERSEARFRDVIERNADAQVVVSPQGVILFANTAAAQLFGRNRDELFAGPFGFPVVVGETTEVDLIVRGAPRVAEMRVVQSEWEGELAYIASLRDVTERKRAEQDARRFTREQAARAAAEQVAGRLRFLLESTTLLSSTLDHHATLATLARLCVEHVSDWTVVYGLNDSGEPERLTVAHRDSAKAAMAEELCEIPIEPHGKHPVLEVLKSRRSRVVSRVTDEALAAMMSRDRELELARALGVSSFMLVPMIARGSPLGAIAFVSSDPSHAFADEDALLAEDIARRAALAVDNALLYEQAKLANQTKADFLAVVSHDLRTPLTAIIGYSDLLLMGIPETLSDDCRDRVQRIQTSAQHLLYLLNELLAFARLDAGAVSAARREIDVRSVIRDVASVMERLAEERRLRFSVDVPDRPVELSTDPDKLRQILLNLTGNAVKYTQSGEVRLKVSHSQSSVDILVSDTGCGIAESDLDHIFDPFWQVDPGERMRAEGAGLGLSVVKGLAALLDARVSVDSKIGEGSVFTLSLPVAA